MGRQKYINSSRERRYEVTLRPRYYQYLEADRHIKSIGLDNPIPKSEMLNDIIEKYYNDKPIDRLRQLSAYYNHVSKPN